MIIALVSDAVYPYNKGGKEKRIYEMSTRLAKKGHTVTVYCMKWWKSKENIRKEHGVYLHAISPYYPLYSGKRRSVKQAFFFSLHLFKLLKENFDFIDADHMPHLVLFPLKIVSFLKGKKLYATWNEVWGRDYWKHYLGNLSGEFAYWIEWLSARLPDRIIAVSSHTKNKLKENLKIHKPMWVIPNGLDLEFIEKVHPSKEQSDVFFAGRLLSHKNVDILIKTIALLKSDYPSLICFIVGNGPEEKNLKKQIAELKLQNNIKIFDFFDDQIDYYAYMKSSKVFVFPSTREGFGIAALEANACGLPVITVNHPDNAAKELIDNDKNGSVVDLDPEKIAEEIRKFLKEKKGRNYREYVKKYDWDSVATLLKEVYTK